MKPIILLKMVVRDYVLASRSGRPTDDIEIRLDGVMMLIFGTLQPVPAIMSIGIEESIETPEVTLVLEHGLSLTVDPWDLD